MSLYLLLGLDTGATRRDVERAYKRLARKYHPDLNPGDARAAAVFEQVTEAYETLIDPERRRRYDRDGRTDDRPARQAYRFRGFDFTGTAGAGMASSVQELFDDLLERPPAGAGVSEPGAGADVTVDLELSFEEAIRGGEHAVTVTRLGRCRECASTGSVAAPGLPCRRCEGTGSTRWIRGHMVFARDCAACAGTGRLERRVCSTCHGEGVTPRSDRVVLRVPPGVADGASIRVTDEGHAGRRGGPSGHLYARVTVRPHAVFRRVGDDLVLTVPLAIHEAALGTRVTIPTIDGPATLRIPPGTQTGQRFRMRERGVLSPLLGRRGDLLVEVELVMPGLIDERSKEIFRELARLHPENVRAGLWTGTS